MQERIEEMFAKMYPMTDGLKKKSYDKWMAEFREKHGQTFQEMAVAVEQSESRAEEAKNIAGMFADVVEHQFSKRGKISAPRQVDINSFMIYYVFPTILLTQSECAVLLADALRDEWRGRFRNSSQLAYTDYDTIRGSFNEKIMGMF